MQVIVHPALLVVFLGHCILDLMLLEFSSAPHFVNFHVEHLVGSFRFRFHDLQLLAMVSDLCNDVVDLAFKILDGASQRVVGWWFVVRVV